MGQGGDRLERRRLPHPHRGRWSRQGAQRAQAASGEVFELIGRAVECVDEVVGDEPVPSCAGDYWVYVAGSGS